MAYRLYLLRYPPALEANALTKIILPQLQGAKKEYLERYSSWKSNIGYFRFLKFPSNTHTIWEIQMI